MSLNPFVSINPFNQEVNAQYTGDTEQEILFKLTQAVKAQKHWAAFSVADRTRLLLRLAQLLREQKSELARLITIEMGKPITQSVAELEKCAACCEWYAENAIQSLEPESVERANSLQGRIFFKPLGIVLALMPWNFPFWQVFRCAVPALTAGNGIALKLANNTPGCGFAIEKLFLEAGFPAGLLTNFLVDIPQIERLIAAPEIAAVSLTGSEKAGRSVAGIAGTHLKKCVLELGGSDPFLVFPDADLQMAAQAAADSRMLNNGQSCIAAKRFIVHPDVIGDFVDIWDQSLQAKVWGNPLSPQSEYSCLAGKQQAQNFRAQITRGLAAGAKLLRPSNFNSEADDNIIHPNIISWVDEKNPLFKEELFGPIGILMLGTNEAEMVEIANNHPYALGASIWTKDVERVERLTQNLDCGTLAVNDFVKSSPEMPFGGLKSSGYGRELSKYGILEFVNILSRT